MWGGFTEQGGLHCAFMAQGAQMYLFTCNSLLKHNGKTQFLKQTVMGNRRRQWHPTPVLLPGFKDGAFIYSNKDIAGNIQYQVDETINFIKTNIHQSIFITGKAEHDRYWDYPINAIRETITNAICHRDYGSPYTIQVKVIEDRIIIDSPGSLPFDMSIDMLMEDYHPSRPRNKIIAQAFYDMHLTEFYGSGIKRIREECKTNGNASPTFQEKMNTFTTTYFPRQLDETIKLENDSTYDPLSNLVLKIINENPRISLAKLIKLTGKSRATITRVTSLLQKMDLIEHRGSNKKGGYYIIEDKD